MKKLMILGVAAVVFVTGVLAQAAEPARDHGWLAQLVGEWDVDYKMYMQPDAPPFEAKGTDHVRAIGANWVMAESKTTMMGAPFSGVLSVGYDAQKERFNATWIDSMGGHLWVYKCTLNEAGDTLTLETKGPSFEDPSKTTRYKEVMQMTGKDTRTFSSSVEKSDGTWMTILTAEYRRK